MRTVQYLDLSVLFVNCFQTFFYFKLKAIFILFRSHQMYLLFGGFQRMPNTTGKIIISNANSVQSSSFWCYERISIFLDFNLAFTFELDLYQKISVFCIAYLWSANWQTPL